MLRGDPRALRQASAQPEFSNSMEVRALIITRRWASTAETQLCRTESQQAILWQTLCVTVRGMPLANSPKNFTVAICFQTQSAEHLTPYNHTQLVAAAASASRLEDHAAWHVAAPATGPTKQTLCVFLCDI
jgi:hypothetical protein